MYSMRSYERLQLALEVVKKAGNQSILRQASLCSASHDPAHLTQPESCSEIKFITQWVE